MRRLTRRSSVLVIFSCLALLSFAIGATKLFLRRMAVEKHVGPVRVFEVSPNPTALTQELALEKAREVLNLEGLNPNDWQPIHDPEEYLVSRGYRLASTFGTSPPSGREEPFLTREKKRANCGILIFLDEAGAVRFVRVALAGKSVLGQCSGGL
jgi:hypothetical protein